jgi:hypothetical protein
VNTRLLRRVQKHILAEPRRLNMDCLLDSVSVERKTNPPCGTVGCIAGWAAFLTQGAAAHVSSESWLGAQDALALTSEQALRLFVEPKYAVEKSLYYGDETWPLKFARKYLSAKTARQRAKVTAARIDHFIATKGAE